MRLFSRRFLSFALALTAPLTAACAKGLTSNDPIPEINYCSNDAAQHACQIDSQFAGTYPAIDNLATAARNAGRALGCGYGVSLDGQILYAGGTGFTDNGAVDPTCANQNPACQWGLDNLSVVASVSKTLTAIAVMNLFEEGKLAIDPTILTVGDLLPAAPDTLADLTLHELLSHTSGLDADDYDDGFGTEWWLMDRYPELDHPGTHPRAMWYGLKGNVVPDPTLVDPDNGVGNYSNAAYRILGAIVDAHTIYDIDEVGINGVTQLSEKQLSAWYLGGYEDYVRDQIAHPGLAYDEKMATACQHGPWREPGLDTFVQGFLWSVNPANTPWTPAGFLPAPEVDMVGKRGPSGGWMMTIGDLLRLGNGMAKRLFVSDATLTRMRTFVASALGFNFGYGLMILPQTFTNDPSGVSYPGYGHAGNLSQNGYSAMWRIVELPGGRSLGAAIMCNEDIGATRMNTTLGQMMDQVYTDFIANGAKPNPIAYDPSMARCDELGAADPIPATLELSVDYGDALKSAWAGFMKVAGNDLAKAESLARREVSTYPEGAKILRAWDAGDVETAAELGLALMERAFARSQPTAKESTR